MARTAIRMVCLLGCVLTAVACENRPSAGPEPKRVEPKPTLRLALVTDLQGAIEPCGCTSDPKGGVDRMATALARLRSGGVPTLFILVGDTLFGQASIDDLAREQERSRAATLTEILKSLGADAVVMGIADARHKGLLKTPPAAILDHGEATIKAWGATQVGLVSIGNDSGSVAVAKKNANELRDRGADVVVVLGLVGRRDAMKIAALPAVDFVVQGGIDEKQPIAPRPSGDGWVVHAGRQGEYLAVVDLNLGKSGQWIDRSQWSVDVKAKALDAEIKTLGKKIERWKAAGNASKEDLQTQVQRWAGLKSKRKSLNRPKADGQRSFDMTLVALSKAVDSNGGVRALMVAHDKKINAYNKVALADLKPAPPEQGQAAFVGSQACAGCHSAATRWWTSHPHGQAYQTLQQRHKEFRLDCVGCHVTGYNVAGGSTVTHNLDGALTNVGCESCHGPGRAHIKDPSAQMVRNPPEQTCVACHNDEHSDLFDYERYRKTLLVPGHGQGVKQ